MALEKGDFTTISRYVRDVVARIPPRPISAVGIGRVLGTPEADTPNWIENSDRIATTAYVKSQSSVTNVKDYGAVGDGFTDDTAAIQSAANAALGGGGHLHFPGNFTYNISSPISIPNASAFTISGDSRAGTTINQTSNNTPIFEMTHTNTWGWTIRDLKLQASTAQPATNTHAAGLMVTNSAGVYNWVMENIYFNNLANGVFCDTGTGVWGGTMRDIFVQATVSRSLFQAVSPSGGQPNMKFINCYVLATTMVGPILDLAGYTHTWITGFEVNKGLLGPTLIKDTAGGSYAIGTMKIEVGTYSASVTSSSMFNLANSELMAEHIELDTITADLTGVAYPQNSIFRLGGVGSGTKIHVMRLTGLSNWTITNGTFFVVGGAATGTTVVFDHLDALPTNVLLSNITSDGTTANTVQVMDWNDGQLSADQGDTSVTVTPGYAQPNILSFETALTANRTVTLPSSTAAGNLFNGLTYTVVRSGLGAFTLAVLDGVATIDTFPAGQGGAMTFTYRRNKWVKTMKSLF